MIPGSLEAALDRITRVRGVRGALLVSTDDGLVVAETLMEGIRGNAVAALAASLATRLGRAMAEAGTGEPRFVHLAAGRGKLLFMPAPDRLLVVALTDHLANVGLTRLEMQQAIEGLG